MREKTKEELIEHFQKFWEFVATYSPDLEVKEKFKTNIPPLLQKKLKLVPTEEVNETTI